MAAKTTHTAIWSDTQGNCYEQKMELAPGDCSADLAHHEAWVRENHDIATYKVISHLPLVDPNDWS